MKLVFVGDNVTLMESKCEEEVGDVALDKMKNEMCNFVM